MHGWQKNVTSNFFGFCPSGRTGDTRESIPSMANCSERAIIKLANAASSTLKSVGSPLTNASISTFSTVFFWTNQVLHFTRLDVVNRAHTRKRTHKGRGRVVEEWRDRRSRTGKYRRDSSRNAHRSLFLIPRIDKAQLFRRVRLVSSQHGWVQQLSFLQRVGKLQRQVLDRPHEDNGNN